MNDIERRALIGAAGIGAIAALSKAGPLNPPAGTVAPTGRTLEELRAYVDEHPEMKKALYVVPKRDDVIGKAANFVLHVAERMAAEGSRRVA